MNGSTVTHPPKLSVTCQGWCGANLKGRRQAARTLYDHLRMSRRCREDYLDDNVRKGGCVIPSGLPSGQLVIAPTVHSRRDYSSGATRLYAVVGLGVDGDKVLIDVFESSKTALLKAEIMRGDG